jgi:proliferating cell nuclear antigen
MFEIELKNEDKKRTEGSDALNLIKRVVESLLEIVEEAELVVRGDGISIQAMDSMHVVMADVFLSCSMFQHYRCDRELVLGLYLKHMAKVLRTITLEGDDVLRIVCDDSCDDLAFQRTGSSYSLDFKLKLFSFKLESYQIPPMQCANEIVMPSDIFSCVVRNVASFGDRMGIRAEQDSVVFALEGGEANAAMALHPSSDSNGIAISVSGPVLLHVATKYITLANKLAPLCGRAKISLGDCMPVVLELEFGGGSYVRFYVAPKLDVE